MSQVFTLPLSIVFAMLSYNSSHWWAAYNSPPPNLGWLMWQPWEYISQASNYMKCNWPRAPAPSCYALQFIATPILKKCLPWTAPSQWLTIPGGHRLPLMANFGLMTPQWCCHSIVRLQDSLGHLPLLFFPLSFRIILHYGPRAIQCFQAFSSTLSLIAVFYNKISTPLMSSWQSWYLLANLALWLCCGD